MVLHIKPIFQRNRGFTLMELVLVLGLSSVLILCLYNLLGFTMNTCKKVEDKDKLLLNGRHSIEFIKDEIKAADMIISSEKFSGLKIRYPTNIGFVILKIDRDKDYKPIEYRYSTFYTNKDKIVRIACSRISERYPSYSYFSGNNTLCEFSESILNTEFIPEDNMIYLDLRFVNDNGEELILKSDILIRCPMDY